MMMRTERRWISMARTRSISSIEAEIAKAEAELNKAQEKVDAISAKLLKLQKQKQEHEARQIMEAYKKSGKSLQELMTFLDV
jgi:septal ring factor EnvC (AmiA/AmiB activator)